jgi:hypothetical protein
MSEAPPWDGGRPLLNAGLIAGAIGLIGWIIGIAVETRQALFSLLTAYAYLTSLVLGALIFLMSVHAARSEWPIAVRRLVEAITGALPLLIVFFIPIAIGLGHIYVWNGAEPADKSMRAAIAHKGVYFSVWFFLARSFFYLTAWVGIGYFLRRWSLRQDRDGDPRWNTRQWALSGIGLVVLSLTLTFAAFDWFMSLTPDWRSSIYGVYFFAGGFLAAFSLLVILMRASERAGLLNGAINPAHYLSTGKYMLAFTIFWTYTAYAQFFIIWIADIPSEASWWVPRIHGWGPVSLVLIVTHFIIPFSALLSRGLKLNPPLLALLSAWILVAHYIDMYWLVAPALHKDAPHLSWLDLMALLLVLGSAVALSTWRARGYPLVATADPRFAASVAYEGS